MILKDFTPKKNKRYLILARESSDWQKENLHDENQIQFLTRKAREGESQILHVSSFAWSGKPSKVWGDNLKKVKRIAKALNATVLVLTLDRLIRHNQFINNDSKLCKLQAGENELNWAEKHLGETTVEVYAGPFASPARCRSLLIQIGRNYEKNWERHLKYLETLKPEIYQLKADGYSLKDIEYRTGIKIHTVRKWLKEVG